MAESIQQTLEELKNPQISPKDQLEHLNKLVELSEQLNDDISKIVPLESFIAGVRKFVASSTRTLRTSSLRVLRYYMRREDFIKAMYKMKVDYFITRSLERDKLSEAERMQALKLVRKILEINSSLIPYHVIHSLVSVAEHPEDNFFRVAVETICELSIRNPKACAHCGGIKVILHGILNPSLISIQESLVIALIYLLNESETRKYVRTNFDIGVILAPLTVNFSATDKDKDGKWETSISAITMMLRTWSGLIVLSSNPLGLKSIVNALKLPNSELHDKILNAFFKVFRLTVPENANPFTFTKAPSQFEDTEFDLGTRSRRHNLINNFLSALLVAFIDCGLIEALIEIGSRRRKLGLEKGEKEEKEINNISTKATLLLGEILFLTNNLLPSSQCAKVQTLPSLVEYAASFQLDPRLRSKASSMVTNLHQYHHLKHTSSIYDFHLSLILGGANKWKRMKRRDRRLDRMDDVKMKIDFAMDVEQLKNKIAESQVNEKDYQKWKWDIISDLLEGPFNNPILVNYALQRTRFVNRILSFLRPSQNLFSRMPWKQSNLKYVRMACQLLEVLISTDTGRDFLKENKLFMEIANQLKIEKEKPDDPKNKEIRLLSQEGLLKTMSREYFTMLGTLSSTERGLEILNKWNIMKLLIDLSQLQGREDLRHLIMTSLDYNMPGDSRVILSQALTSPAKAIRYIATKHMRVLLRAGVQEFSNWGIDLLFKQLSDEDAKIMFLALNILDEACDDEECLDSLITKKPKLLLEMGIAGKNLWLKLLSRPQGFAYLKEMGFIEKEIELWNERLTVQYVHSVEAELSEAFFPSPYKVREPEETGVHLKPHIFGELAQTEEGCNMLKQRNVVSQLLDSIKDVTKDSIERRAAIWALGHIASSKYSSQFFDTEIIVETLINLAERSPSISIRGTSFFVLGIMSKVLRTQLEKRGWESPNSHHSYISVPKEMKSNLFFQLPEEAYEGTFATSPDIEYPNETDPIDQEILTAVTHLSNFISAESASKTIKRLKEQHPDKFTPVMMLKVFKLLGTFKFRLPVRRFVYNIFDDFTYSDEILQQIDRVSI